MTTRSRSSIKLLLCLATIASCSSSKWRRLPSIYTHLSSISVFCFSTKWRLSLSGFSDSSRIIWTKARSFSAALQNSRWVGINSVFLSFESWSCILQHFLFGVSVTLRSISTVFPLSVAVSLIVARTAWDLIISTASCRSLEVCVQSSRSERCSSASLSISRMRSSRICAHSPTSSEIHITHSIGEWMCDGAKNVP